MNRIVYQYLQTGYRDYRVTLRLLRAEYTALTKGKSWDVRARGNGEFGRFVERAEGRDPLYKFPPEITTFYTTLLPPATLH